MAHTFLLEEGRWTLQGNWLERDSLPIPLKGKTIIAWSQENWFTWVTKLIFPGGEREEIAFQYRGRLEAGERQYNFVLQQSLLGRVEGEGWVAPESIVQRYIVLSDDDRQRRSGFETLYRLDDNTYFLSSGIMTGYSLTSTMEAILQRQG
ncbi:hypothetical protein K4A83_10605 [Spirulina subsalsa FACHB-351]|uniref:DUF4178 domain-containing protein n=1 Tax=Spirulina subsalsa FACHB-351 TaxID=234711 RepID=A0ABT3L5B1_9CYAN|nr:hypothetical protein [Spirulina subsalsa]MCW6036708.1 hypothetical protein [Spirulina subsalsa FACHB-351]